MNTEITKIQKNGITLMKRDGRFILQKSFAGVGQKQIRLGTKQKEAFTKAARFLLTAETDSYDKAIAELKGKKVLKKGDDPSVEQIEQLYRDYCIQSPKPPRPITIAHNIARLKCLMKRAGVSTIGKIDQKSLFNKEWYDGDMPTPKEKRTFASAVKAAQSIFKGAALRYYVSQGLTIPDPFHGLELVAPMVPQFVPPPTAVIQNILDTVENELKPNEAMIVLLAFCGLRRSEIEAIVPANFSRQPDHVVLSIEETGPFQPKAGKSGNVAIPHEMYERLLKLRDKTDSMFFVPSDSKKDGTGRLWEPVRRVNVWLKKNGLKNKPLHSCRKIVGSIVAKTDGIPAAANILRNTPQVCMTNYAGAMTVKCVDVAGSLTTEDPFQTIAQKLGISVEDVKKRLSA